MCDNRGWWDQRSARLEQEHSDLTDVEVDEVFGLVSYIGAEVASYNAVPRGLELPIEFFLDVGSNILLDVELLKCYVGAVKSSLLHFL